MRLEKRIKKYATSRKVRAYLGLRPPIFGAQTLETWRGYVPATMFKGRSISFRGRSWLQTMAAKAGFNRDTRAKLAAQLGIFAKLQAIMGGKTPQKTFSRKAG